MDFESSDRTLTTDSCKVGRFGEGSDGPGEVNLAGFMRMASISVLFENCSRLNRLFGLVKCLLDWVDM